MTRGQRRRLAVVVASVVLLGGVAVLAATAGSGSDGEPTGVGTPPAASATSPGPPVIVPGRPGESASTVPANEIKAPDGTAYTLMDAAFVRMMIPHHAQAIEMAALAPSRGRNPQIRAIAERIRIGQDGEIARLRAWLAARGLDDRIPEHDHGTMRGMQSPEAMRALAAASGADFDRMFVDMMSRHHQGAIDMATDVLSVGKDEEVERLATDIASEQAIEIARMREALAS